MGLSLKKITKSISSAVPKKISAPKIKIGDPTKLVTAPIEGVSNATSRVLSSVIKSQAGVANTALDSAGSVLQNPNAASVLSIAGTATGNPELGLLAGGLGRPNNAAQTVNDPGYSTQSGYAGPQQSFFQQYGLYIGLGVLGLGGMFFLMRRK